MDITNTVVSSSVTQKDGNVTHLPVLDNSRVELQERISLYIDAILDGKSKRESYIIAGYADDNTGSNASKFHKRYNTEIQREYSVRISDRVPVALNALTDIILYGKSETAIVKASLEILDRAGHDKMTRIQVSQEKPKTHAELQSELAELMKNASPDVKLLEN